MANRKKIGLIGAGNIGGELARLCANKELGDVFLFDIPAKENFAKGKALDLEQNSSVLGYDASVTGTGKWEDMAGADMIAFYEGFTQGARCTLHLRVQAGRDPHHSWEAAARAFAVALRGCFGANPFRAGLTAGVKGTLD